VGRHELSATSKDKWGSFLGVLFHETDYRIMILGQVYTLG